jgi:hypothetical protein
MNEGATSPSGMPPPWGGPPGLVAPSLGVWAPSDALWASSGPYRSPVKFYGIWRIFSVETKNMQKIEDGTGHWALSSRLVPEMIKNCIKSI